MYAAIRCVVAVLVLAPLALPQEIALRQIASGISDPTDIQSPPDGTGRLFFVQQAGLIRVFRNDTVLAQPFLDIRARISAGGERGLLGLAFSPAYASSGRFFVNYTNLAGNTVIAQYRVSVNPDVADPASEIILLTIAQPFPNHNGGHLRFGPDGYLYIGMGDGGSGGDPQNNGQRLDSLLGKLLRVDVESSPGQLLIPSQNPFVNRAGARGEIWSFGLRNPWGFSFDRANHDLYIADVGQDSYEEVNYQPAASRGGENYGWRTMEGLHCYNAASCDMQGLTLPVVEYGQSSTMGCSVIGGFVYRGKAWPGLRGTYVYGDYCSGKIWGLERHGTVWTNQLLLNSGTIITVFGEDQAGELYVGDARNSAIHRIEGSLAPRFISADVQNAASFESGISPGSLAAVFVDGVKDDPGIVAAQSLPLPPSLADISITVDGVAAPIHAIANVQGREQVNFQAPFEIAGRAQASMVVRRGSQASAPVVVPVLSLQPAIYTLDGVQGIVVRVPEYVLATADRPLASGGYAYVYAEGLGPVTNQPATGAGAPGAPLAAALSDVRLSLGGVRCQVLFAGLAPELAGMYIVVFQVPSGVPSGVQDLTLEAGAAKGPSVKVSVR